MAHTSAELQTRSRVPGDPRIWARDLGLVGLMTGALAPWPLWLLAPMVPPIIALSGGVGGAATGAAMPHVLDQLRGQMPLWAIGATLTLAGAMIGGLSSLAGMGVGVALGSSFLLEAGTSFQLMLVVLGALVGATQAMWFWFPYTFQSVLSGRRWPLLVGASLAAPILPFALLRLAMVPFS
jgi:hypothetical protein